MSYDAQNIIGIATRISPAGLATGDFSKAMLFAPEAEKPAGMAVNTYRVYGSMPDLAVDFADTTETYKAAQRYMGMIPTPKEIYVFARSNVTGLDTIIETLNIAADMVWWYHTFFTAEIYAAEADMILIADWVDPNIRYNFNCSLSPKIRDPADASCIATQLTTKGTRHMSTVSHATDTYAGHAVSALFSAVKYSIAGSTISAEFKKLIGVDAESLTATEYAAMSQDTKKAMFYTAVDLQGSADSGRVINSWSHSAYGEFVDDVINLDAFTNNLRVAIYNANANQLTKNAQTPQGQAVLLGAAKAVGEQYITNGFLGARTWLNPDTGIEEFTEGYEILSKPEDILTLSDTDRSARKSAPIRVRIFRAGAIHAVDVTVDVY